MRKPEVITTLRVVLMPQGYLSKRSGSLSPTPAPEQKFCPVGDAGYKNRELSSIYLPKKIDFTCNRGWGSSSQKAL